MVLDEEFEPTEVVEDVNDHAEVIEIIEGNSNGKIRIFRK